MINKCFESELGYLVHGDCIEVMNELSSIGVKVDAIITDLPYGITKNDWDKVIPIEEMWNTIKSIKSSDRVPVILFNTEPFSSHLRISNVKEYRYDYKYIKNIKTNFLNAKKQPLRRVEDILVFYKKQCLYEPQMTVGHKPVNMYVKNDKSTVYGKQTVVRGGGNTDRHPDDVLKYSLDKKEKRYHDNQKPKELIEFLVRTYTKQGDTVLDFTCGSATLGIVCEELKRKWICIDNDATNINKAQLRFVEQKKNDTHNIFIGHDVL